MSSDVSREHNEIKVALGKIETKLEHVSEQLSVIHSRINDREDETKAVEALARSNENRLTAIETTSRTNRAWIIIGLTAVTAIATVLAIVF